MGGDQRLTELLERLAAAVHFADDDRSAALRRALADLQGDQWMRLDELARRLATHDPLPSMSHGTTWPAVDSAPDPVAAVAASKARDGRVRERAVDVLGRFRGPAVAAAIAVRCDDWVPEVAQRAGTALAAYGDEREVAAVVGGHAAPGAPTPGTGRGRVPAERG